MQLAGEHGKPPVLLVDLRCTFLRAREPDRHTLAKAESPVVPSVDLYRADGEVGPGGELRGDQRSHQRRGNHHISHGEHLLGWPEQTQTVFAETTAASQTEPEKAKESVTGNLPERFTTLTAM